MHLQTNILIANANQVRVINLVQIKTETMRPFDFLGLKNFRVFDDKNGFFEKLASITLLTGANNSGKSSLIKSLQMLKDSVKTKQIPFDLDLTKQEHLLGDFENLLSNKDNRVVEISLPFTFMGIRRFYIILSFSVSSRNAYNAYLRGMNIVDQYDDTTLFSFKYREATEAEIGESKLKFKSELEEYNKTKAEAQNHGESIFSSYGFLFPPHENPLIGYVEWTIQMDKLKAYLTDLKGFYEVHLVKRRDWESLERSDKTLEKSDLVPSLFLKSLKGDVSIDSWNEFIETKLGDQIIVSGSEEVCEDDLQPEDYFFPAPQIEEVFYYKSLNVLKDNLKWTSQEEPDTNYSIIENSFRNSWQILVNRIETINYVSTTKEENLRIYNAGNNSPFIKLLHDYRNSGYATSFLRKYLAAFEIGSALKVEYQPKYQLMSVSIRTLDGYDRELVDFGYGIKQLIVFLIQISVLAEKNKRSEHGYDDDGEYMIDVYDPSLLLIEEPESNLHPKWQSLMAEMFMEANRDFNIQLIIETHSEYLIRRFQTLVAEKKLTGNQVKILYLRDIKKAGDKPRIESVTIQDDGSINYEAFDSGFFDESEKLELSLLNVKRDRFWQDFQKLKQSKHDNEEKIVELQKRIDDYTNQLDATVYTHIIDSRFDVSKLSRLTVQYLASGQYLLHTIDSFGDFSPVIIQYGRAVEYELKRKLFLPVNSGTKWMLGEMQGSLSTIFTIPTPLPRCNARELSLLNSEISSKFVNPSNLRIDLLEDIRVNRNLAGHAGQTMTKLEAEAYIQSVDQFLDSWLADLI